MVDMPRVLADLARAIAREPDQPLPARLCRACADILGMDGGSIVLGYLPQRMLMCATDEDAMKLERVHEVLGEGPGTDAYRSGGPVTGTLHSRGAGQWPLFTTAAFDIFGPVTILAVPMRATTSVVGVLTLYQRGEHPANEELTAAQVLADAVAAALLKESESQDLTAWGPWAERARIDQATGIVIAQLGIGPEDALALLRAHAYADDTTVDAIASQVVERRLDFSVTDRQEDENP
jgi:hypothetical protein